MNFSDPDYVHEAVVAWVEDIMDNNFTVCVTQAGRNKRRNGETFATVDWLAYQGAPDGGVSGQMDMPTWWTGTSCRTASLPLVGSNIALLLCRFSFLMFTIILPSPSSLSPSPSLSLLPSLSSSPQSSLSTILGFLF